MKKASQLANQRADEWAQHADKVTAEYYALRERREPSHEEASEYVRQNYRNLGIVVELRKLAAELREAGL